ncbi:MAG: glycosyltransferase family 2 protein [Planctomycetes bacterium]|nr:glycosyltransferase family 2 protein [Planctomycetota bacterium]
MTAPELSLLVVNYNSWRLCVEALASFCQHAPRRADGTPMPYEAIVVDNASPLRDPQAERELAAACAATGGRLVLHGENGGYSSGMNLARRHARGRWLVVSHPDIRVLPDAITPLLRAMERDPSIGAAAPRNYWDTGREAILPPNILPTLGDLLRLTASEFSIAAVRAYSRRRTRDAVRVWSAAGDVELPMLSGCCFLMRAELVERIGFFDERFPLYFEDTDLSVRIRKARARIVQIGGAEVVHFFDRSGQTANELKMERYWRSRRLYYRKWYGPLGACVYDLTRKLVSSAWVRRRSQRIPHRAVVDLGAGHGKPLLRLPRPCARFLVELCLDPKFFLAGGIFGAGDSWTPGNAMFSGFGPTTYWFRVVDASKPDLPEIAVFKWQQLFPAVGLPHGPEADALGKVKLREFQELQRSGKGG